METELRLLIADWYFLSADEIDQIVDYYKTLAENPKMLPIRVYNYIAYQLSIVIGLDDDSKAVTILLILAAYVQNPNPPFYLDDWLKDNNILESI